MLKESPKTIEEMLGREGACGCLQVAGVGFNGLIFPQIDLARIGLRGRRRIKKSIFNGLIYFFKQTSKREEFSPNPVEASAYVGMNVVYQKCTMGQVLKKTVDRKFTKRTP